MDPKETVERHYLEYLRSNERFNERWLLMQNLATTELRQKVLAALDLAEGHQVLDLGCGFGVLTLDLAAGTPVQVTGIDTSEQKIRVANQVLHSILETVGNLPGQVVFKVDDGYNLPFANEQFDWVISQYVFEHLKNPLQVTQGIFRVLRPGGHVCIVDIDDGPSITYPQQLSFVRLNQLLRQVHKSKGGDRQIGRKLPNLLQESGLQVLNVVPLIQAQFASAAGKALSFTLLAQQLGEIRHEAILKGFVGPNEFDNLLTDFLQHPSPHTLQFDVQFVVVAQKP